MLGIRPSEICFSQDSINNVWDRNSSHANHYIGKTLDALCEGRCSVSSIPTISVLKRNGRWITADNRRLWVFREMERLGKCDSIYVRETSYIPAYKMTSYNGGTSVRVRRSPGGYWHLKDTPRERPSTSVAERGSPAGYGYLRATPTAEPERPPTSAGTSLRYRCLRDASREEPEIPPRPTLTSADKYFIQRAKVVIQKHFLSRSDIELGDEPDMLMVVISDSQRNDIYTSFSVGEDMLICKTSLPVSSNTEFKILRYMRMYGIQNNRKYEICLRTREIYYY